MQFRSGTSDAIYATEQIGRTRYRTPEGFLFVEEVPIGRIGTMLYRAGEVPVTPGPDGIVRILRDETEVFRPETLASFTGKAVTNDHPPEDVGPNNWVIYSKGIVLSPRRGEGMWHDYMMADLLVTDASAIDDVEKGKIEVSSGYNADYEEIKPGEGRQHNIIGNHVALVERGRCGPRCSIGDEEPMAKGAFAALMSAFSAKDNAAIDRAVQAVKDELVETTAPGVTSAGDPASGGVQLHVHTNGSGENAAAGNGDIEARVAALEDGMTEIGGQVSEILALLQQNPEPNTDPDEGEGEGEGEGGGEGEGSRDAGEGGIAGTLRTHKEGEIEWQEPPSTGDRRTVPPRRAARRAGRGRDNHNPGIVRRAIVNGRVTRDTETIEQQGTGAMTRDEVFADTIARAEILAPGIRVPTMDARTTDQQAMDTICALRRRALTTAIADQDIGDIVETVAISEQRIKSMPCSELRAVFVATSELVKQANNNTVTRHAGSTRDAGGRSGGQQTGIQSTADWAAKNREFWKNNQYQGS